MEAATPEPEAPSVAPVEAPFGQQVNTVVSVRLADVLSFYEVTYALGQRSAEEWPGSPEAYIDGWVVPLDGECMLFESHLGLGDMATLASALGPPTEAHVGDHDALRIGPMEIVALPDSRFLWGAQQHIQRCVSVLPSYEDALLGPTSDVLVHVRFRDLAWFLSLLDLSTSAPSSLELSMTRDGTWSARFEWSELGDEAAFTDFRERLRALADTVGQEQDATSRGFANVLATELRQEGSTLVADFSLPREMAQELARATIGSVLTQQVLLTTGYVPGQ